MLLGLKGSKILALCYSSGGHPFSSYGNDTMGSLVAFGVAFRFGSDISRIPR